MAKNNLKLVLSLVGILVCFVLILRGVAYKNIFLLLLIALSMYFGKIYGSRKRQDKLEKPKETPAQNIPQEFKDEQEKFKQLNEEGGFEK